MHHSLLFLLSAKPPQAHRYTLLPLYSSESFSFPLPFHAVAPISLHPSEDNPLFHPRPSRKDISSSEPDVRSAAFFPFHTSIPPLLFLCIGVILQPSNGSFSPFFSVPLFRQGCPPPTGKIESPPFLPHKSEMRPLFLFARPQKYAFSLPPLASITESQFPPPPFLSCQVRRPESGPPFFDEGTRRSKGANCAVFSGPSTRRIRPFFLFQSKGGFFLPLLPLTELIEVCRSLSTLFCPNRRSCLPFGPLQQASGAERYSFLDVFKGAPWTDAAFPLLPLLRAGQELSGNPFSIIIRPTPLPSPPTRVEANAFFVF